VYGTNPANPAAPPTTYGASQGATTDFTQYNPYVATTQFQASFLSAEGAQSIQNMMGGQQAAVAYSQALTTTQAQYAGYSQPPPPVVPGAPPPMTAQYPPMSGTSQYPPGYNPSQYPASAIPPGPPVAGSQTAYGQPQAQTQQYQQSSYPVFTQGQYTNYPPPTQHNQQAGTQYQQGGAGNQQYSGASQGQQPGPGGRHRGGQHQHPQQRQPRPSSNLATVRITGR